MLDVEQPSEALGKTAGKDAQQHKITFPAVYGLERSREMAEEERLPRIWRWQVSTNAPNDSSNSPTWWSGATHDGGASEASENRLDQILVDRGLADSREKARALILAGHVLVEGQKSDKPGHSFPSECKVEVAERMPYVSRGGYKLAAALDHFR